MLYALQRTLKFLSTAQAKDLTLSCMKIYFNCFDTVAGHQKKWKGSLT